MGPDTEYECTTKPDSAASSSRTGLCANQPTERLAEAYDKAMEQQRVRVAEHSRELAIAENHLRQLKETVVMKRNHHREVAGELRSMEELYAKWKTLTHNAEITGSALLRSPG